MTNNAGRVRVSVSPIRTIRGKRWTITLTHENSNQLFHSNQRYSRKADAEAVAVNVVNGNYRYDLWVD